MNKLLIANRGEIALRIIRTARTMGTLTVAVFSDVDADAPHVRAADEAVAIGPAPAALSYLDQGKILDAARRTGADAVHPGYGFLSENAGFAAAVAGAGLIWVGPPAAAIDAMGLKDAAKRVMKAAGVPVTPGYQGADQSLSRLEHAARAIGYPLLIKATAGGGGKGMRRVNAASEFPEALVGAQREAERAFGHSEVLIEKYVVNARHVEVQVFADAHGNAVHLFERDCSLQRRHQKVIEEAPAPGLSDRLRHTLGIAAVTAAMAIDYRNAGTVEFIVDLDAHDEHGDPKFYFMEMNTRLQVEHPVTEAITGLDLVEWQLRVARGEPLPLLQEQIACNGHAMEARLYAENPEGGFLPSTGTLTRLRLPGGPGVRVDAGVAEGGEVTAYYDPMIAKIITHASTREGAAARLVAALDATRVEGPSTNRAFLARLASAPDFVAGKVSTGFIDAHHDALFAHAPASRAALAASAVVATDAVRAGPFAAFADFRVNLVAGRVVDLYEGETRHTLGVTRTAGQAVVEGAGAPMAARLRLDGDGRVTGDIDGEPMTATVFLDAASVDARLAGVAHVFALTPPRAGPGAGPVDGRIVSPMPGRVLQVAVRPGQTVGAGERLLVLEAMKMEHRMTAPAAATVRAVLVAEGDQVAEGAALVELDLA